VPLTPSHGYTIFCNLQVIYLFIYLIWPHQNTDIHWTSTSALEVPSTRHVTIGDRSFGVAAARVWNTLPADVTSLSSLPVSSDISKLSYSQTLMRDIVINCLTSVKCSRSFLTAQHLKNTLNNNNNTVALLSCELIHIHGCFLSLEL